MKNWMFKIFTLMLTLSLAIPACSSASAPKISGKIKILVVETFLADITHNIAGDRIQIDTLMPVGMDPHTFEPTPQDVAKIAESQVLIINGAHFEEWLDETLANAGGEHQVIEASAGLISRTPGPYESADSEHAGDPHFWLDPVSVIHYVENIRDGLSALDPAGKSVYENNALEYTNRLKELDTWINMQVQQIPTEKRMLVTNHETFGYFADRYGFQIYGTVIPGTSSAASPSAQQMADLITRIKLSKVKAIFLEQGANTDLAEQIAHETGAIVITNMYTHSTSEAGGEAPTYIDMIMHNVKLLMMLK